MRNWNTATSEADLMAQILLAHSRGEARLFRINSGLSWQGQVIEHTVSRLVLKNPRAVRLACAGFADLAGYRSELITPEYLGRTVAIFSAIEAKFGRNKPTAEQAVFLKLVAEAGGRAGVARSVDDAAEILGV